MKTLLLVIFILSFCQGRAQEHDVESAPQPALVGSKGSEAAATENKNISIFDEEEGTLVKKLTEPFNYDRQGRRDPFRLPEASSVEVPLGGIFGPFLELQEVKLDDVKVKAILLDPVKPKAVIAFPSVNGEGKVIEVIRRVQVGDYLGENFGIIQAIRAGQIVVVQTFVEGEQKSTTTKSLSIRK